MVNWNTVDIIKQKLDDKWDTNYVNKPAFVNKNNQQGKAINKRAEDEIKIQGESRTVEPLDVGKNSFNYTSSVLLTIHSTSGNVDLIYEEIIRIVNQNNTRSDLTGDWDTWDVSDIGINEPRLSNDITTLTIQLKRRGVKP